MSAAENRAAGEECPVSAGEIRVSDHVGESEWDEYVRHHPDATSDHLWRWRHVFHDVFGHECVYLAARRADTIVGVLPLVCFRSWLFGRSVVSLPFLNYGGLLVSEPAAEFALLAGAEDVAREFGAAYVELRHCERRCSALPERQHKVGFRLPLPGSTEELWAALDRKVRNQVRKAQRESFTVTAGGSELVDDFYAVFARNMRDLGTPVYTKRLFVEALRLFHDEARVVVVRRFNEPVAAAITVRFRETVIVPWASSLREYRQLCPNMLLYWTMLERAVGEHAKVFDFGRSSRGTGGHYFKRQWGAQERPLHWEYVLLKRRRAPDVGPEKFDPAVAIWKRLPVRIATLWGPIIVRNVP